MRFLADESCDFAVVRALRDAGHSVRALAELSPLAHRRRTAGVCGGTANGRGHLYSLPAAARKGLAKAVLEVVTEWQERLIGRFVVVQPGRVRIIQTPHRQTPHSARKR